MRIHKKTVFKSLVIPVALLIIAPVFMTQAHGAVTVTVSHFAGYGGAGITDGAANIAQFIKPSAVAIDKDDNAYVLDKGGIRRISPAGIVKTIYKFSESPGSGYLTDNCSINLDQKQVFWIVDCSGTRVIRVSLTGDFINQIPLNTGSNGWIHNDHGAGFLPDGRFIVPVWAVGKIFAVAENGVVTDYFKNKISGLCNSNPRTANLICPSGLAVSDSGEVLFKSDGDKSGLYRLDTQGNATLLPLALNNSSIRYHAGAFYIATNIYSSSATSIQISKLNSSFAIQQIIFSGIYQNNYGISFDLNSKEEIYVAFTDGNQIQVLNSPSILKSTIGNAGFGGRDGPASTATFASPSGITGDDEGNIYVKDYNGVRKISPSGQVSTILKSESSKVNSALLSYSGRFYFKSNDNYLMSVDATGSMQRHFLLSISGESVGGTPREMAIDKNGNIYCVTVKNSDWSNRFIRKYSMNGAFEDLTNIPASSDPTIVIDSEQNLLVNANGITKKYNLSGQVVSSSSNFSTNYGVLLAAGANSGLFSIALDRYGSILNKIDGSTTVNLISAGAVGSTNNGRNSSFNFPQGMYLSKDGDLYIADTGNNVIRKVSLTTTPTDPTPTPTPTPTPKPVTKPATPSFSLINIVGNRININVNLGSATSSRPDSVYLVAPKLGILDSNKLFGDVSGSKASWSIDFDKLLSGAAIPLKVVGVKNGVESEPLEQDFNAPAAVEKLLTNKSAPLPPKNVKSRIVGTSAIISAEATVKAGALATSAYFVSSSFGSPSGNSIIGEVIGAKVLFEIPLRTSMAGKTFPFTIFLANEAGKSLPVQSKFSIPAAPKIPSGTIKLPTQTKAPKTVLCLKGSQTRTFAANSCPPGWKSA
jgi:sugar lactone lactonase YvrE